MKGSVITVGVGDSTVTGDVKAVAGDVVTVLVVTMGAVVATVSCEVGGGVGGDVGNVLSVV